MAGVAAAEIVAAGYCSEVVIGWKRMLAQHVSLELDKSSLRLALSSIQRFRGLVTCM